MGKTIILLGFVATLIVSGIGWSRLSVESYTGDIMERDEYHPCPTLQVRFEQRAVPMAVRTCACPEPAPDGAARTAVHPPKALVDSAVPGDRIGLSVHEYAPLLGSKANRAVKWVLAGRRVGKEDFVVAPAGPLYRSIVLTGLAPFLLAIVLAALLSLLFRPKPGAEA